MSSEEGKSEHVTSSFNAHVYWKPVIAKVKAESLPHCVVKTEKLRDKIAKVGPSYAVYDTMLLRLFHVSEQSFLFCSLLQNFDYYFLMVPQKHDRFEITSVKINFKKVD